jgi:hypothetical protein
MWAATFFFGFNVEWQFDIYDINPFVKKCSKSTSSFFLFFFPRQWIYAKQNDFLGENDSLHYAIIYGQNEQV